MAPPEPVPIPEQIFVFQKERMKGYNRLDIKYQQLFSMAYEEVKRLKKEELSNFTHLSEMNMQLTQEMDIIKNVVKSLQTQTDEIDEFVGTRFSD